MSKGRTRRSRLGGGDIGVCLTRLHHDRFTIADHVFDEVRSRDALRGIEHERLVVEALVDLHRDVVRIGSGSGAEERTLAAMARGIEFIIGGRLSSGDDALVGAPDLLVQIGDGYAPVEIKNHKIESSSGISATSSPLGSIANTSTDRRKFRSSRRRDLLQIAHYRYLLSGVGYASSDYLGGIIGSEKPYRCLWVDLSAGRPSIMDTYVSLQSTAIVAILFGIEHPNTPYQQPSWRSECSRCDWADLCEAELIRNKDVTLLSKIDADDRSLLTDYGITRIDQIAALHPDQVCVADQAVVFQARARTAGRLLRLRDEPAALDVPSARREVDFDIETYNGQIYLAGFLTTVNGDSTYESIVDWTGSHNGEKRLVHEMFALLSTLTGDDTVTLHWTEYERRTLEQAGERHGLLIPGFGSVADWFDGHAVDLCDWVRQNLASPSGYSLKVIAPLCGFTWRDDDPGGRQSEIWFERMLAGDLDMRERILAYNEDDVVAQHEIRRWVRRHDDGRGPGTAIPSVRIWPLEGADSF